MNWLGLEREEKCGESIETKEVIVIQVVRLICRVIAVAASGRIEEVLGRCLCMLTYFPKIASESLIFPIRVIG